MTNEISVKVKIDSNSKELILEVNKLIESLFKKADSEIQKTGKILENQLKAYSNTVQNGTNRYTETVDNSEQAKNLLDTRSINNVSVTQTKSIQEPDTQRSLDIAKDDLSYYERRVQLQTDSYNKEIELANIAYARKTLEIDSSNKPAEEKQRLIDLETDLYNKTIDRMQAGEQLSIINSQIALIDATNSWGNSLNGVYETIGNVLNSYNKIQKVNLENNKKQIKLDTDIAKVREKFGLETKERQEAEQQYTIDSTNLKQETQNAEIMGYAALAGAMASAFEQGSAGAIAFTTLQATLGIASSWTAIAAAWALGLPQALGAVAMVSAAVMPIIGQLTSMGGGKGGGGSKPKFTQQEIDKFNIEGTYNPMIDRLDRQIELLESIDRNGSALKIGVDVAGLTFERDYKLFVNEALGEIHNTLKASWGGTYDFENYIIGVITSVIILTIVILIFFN